MACSTCDGYEFVPGKAGMLQDCPDCRAIDLRPMVWCPTHSLRVEVDGRCRKCAIEAANAEEMIVARARAAKAISAARTVREIQLARDLVVRARIAGEAVAA